MTRASTRCVHDTIKWSLSQSFARAFTDLKLGLEPEFELNAQTLYSSFTEPPQKEWGHYAFPCFSLAKTLKQNPIQIAIQLAQSYSSHSLKNPNPLVDKVEAKGPYVNFFLCPIEVSHLIIPSILSGE